MLSVSLPAVTVTKVNALVCVYRIATLVVVAIAARVSPLLAPAHRETQRAAAVLPPNVGRRLASPTWKATSRQRLQRKVGHLLHFKIKSPTLHVVCCCFYIRHITLGRPLLFVS